MAPRKLDYLSPSGGPQSLATQWTFVTANKLSHVLQDGYFDQFASYGLHRHDRLALTCSSEAEVPETADLIVLDVTDGHVKVMPLSKTDAAL